MSTIKHFRNYTTRSNIFYNQTLFDKKDLIQNIKENSYVNKKNINFCLL